MKHALKNKIWSWGYVLDKTPTAAPFVFGKSKCSLETATRYLGTEQTFYMNSMFSPEYLRKHFPHTEEECFTNCIDNRLSDAHMERIAFCRDVFCTLEHGNYPESATRIARLSLRYKNIKGIHIDDFFSGNPATAWKPEEIRRLRDSVKEINPDLQLAVVTYSHFPDEHQLIPYLGLLDVISRWRWVASCDYWDRLGEEMRKLRELVGEHPRMIHGIYLHDFGSDMKCRYPVPMEAFRKSIAAICEQTFLGTLDGFIIPQSGWFSAPEHFEQVAWMKQYLDWFDATATVV